MALNVCDEDLTGTAFCRTVREGRVLTVFLTSPLAFSTAIAPQRQNKTPSIGRTPSNGLSFLGRHAFKLDMVDMFEDRFNHILVLKGIVLHQQWHVLVKRESIVCSHCDRHLLFMSKKY